MSLLLALTGSTAVDGTGAGSLASITLSAITGSANNGGTLDGTGAGVLAPVSLTAITGSASGTANAAGNLPSITLTTITGGATGFAVGSGVLPSITLAAITGTASGTASANGTGSGNLPSLTLTALTGSANTDAALSFNGGFDMSRPRKVYIKRGKQYLIFNNNEEADSYLAAEKAIETAKKSSRGAAKRVIKALKVVKPEIAAEPKLEELSALIAKFDFKYDLPQLAKNNDIEALYHIQSMLYALQQDEDDIELLLLAL
jgi:hypothetical protein